MVGGIISVWCYHPLTSLWTLGRSSRTTLLLGVLYAALGALTFALNNVTMRRGVVTGSVLQGMALTVPIGGLSFLVMTVAFGELGQLVLFPAVALGWLACQGVVHFVIGRYCNYKSNQLMGGTLQRVYNWHWSAA